MSRPRFCAKSATAAPPCRRSHFRWACRCVIVLALLGTFGRAAPLAAQPGDSATSTSVIRRPEQAASVGRAPSPRVVICVGAGGTPEFAREFASWAARWRQATGQAQAECVIIGLEPDPAAGGEAQPSPRPAAGTPAPTTPPTDAPGVATDTAPTPESDLDRLRASLVPGEDQADQPLWLVLLGHGTFDGRTARFNLRGPDLAAHELARWLKPWSGDVACLVCTSSSAPFLKALAGPRRVVISATRGGAESSFARLGGELSSALLDPAADLDKDDQVSLLEAWLLGASRVREFYAREGRLATEHALLDDNGDGLGTPADWFTGVIATRAPRGGGQPDGLLARRWILRPNATEAGLTPSQRARRETLEDELAQLRTRRAEFSEEAYLDAIEPVLIELSRLAGEPSPEPAATPPQPPAGAAPGDQ